MVMHALAELIWCSSAKLMKQLQVDTSGRCMCIEYWEKTQEFSAKG